MRRSIGQILLVILALSPLLSACSGGGSGTTAVTIIAGGGKGNAKAAFLRKAAPAVATVVFRVSGSGMADIIRIVPVTPPQTISVTLYVPNGPSRTFAIEGRDALGLVLFQGSAQADLGGTPVSVALPLQATFFNGLVSTPTTTDETTTIARDPAGDLIIAGHTYGDLAGAGSNANPAHTTADVFVTKMSASGNRIWTVQFGTAADDVCYSAATDGAGNIYLGGSTAGGLNGEALAGAIDAFVTKLSPTGLVLWTRLTGTAGSTTFGNAIAVDPAGTVYLTGDTTGSLEGNNAGNFDLFVTKLSPTGLPLWTVQEGSSAADFSETVALNAAGNQIVIAGSTRGDLWSANTGTGTTDAHIIVYDALGTFQTSTQFGSANDDDIWAVKIDANGAIIVAGGTAGDLAAPGALVGLTDAFVAKYTVIAGFNRVWINQVGTAGTDVALDLTMGALDSVFITGSTDGSLDGLGNAGGNDVFVAAYDAIGSPLWIAAPISQFGSTADDEGVAVATDGATLFVAGNTAGAFTPQLSTDVMLLSFDSATGIQR